MTGNKQDGDEPAEGGRPGRRGALGGPRTAKDRVTIYEVAKRAGVSIATVSHALNRPERVNAATRDRVLDAVDELGFTPKSSAVSLARKGVGRIGVLGPFTAYPTYLSRLAGVLDACRDKNIDIVVFDESPDSSGTSPWLQTLPATGRLDGLLVMGAAVDDRAADRLLDRAMPAVLVDTVHQVFSSVNVDDDLGGYLLGRHLVDLGHDSFAFVSPAPPSADVVSPGEHRLQGLTRALSEGGHDVGEVTWLITEDDLQGGREAVEDLLKLPKLPRAVVGHHDALAAGVIGGLRRAEIAVPQQVAVAGYDGLDLALAMGLTTVRQPLWETGRIGAQLLLDRLTGGEQTVQHIKLAPELVVGHTT